MRNKSLYQGMFIGCTALLLCAAGAAAQEETPGVATPNRQMLQERVQVNPQLLAIAGKPLQREAILGLVAEQTPSWNNTILRVPNTKAWATSVDPGKLAELLQDDDLANAVKRADGKVAIDGRTMVQSDAVVLRVDSAAGGLRYINRKRTFSEAVADRPLPDEGVAKRMAGDFLQQIGISERQLNDPLVNTQLAIGGTISDAENKVSGEPEEVYRLVTYQRRINDLPVFGSRAQFAVNHQGQFQRARVTWPSIKLDTSDKLVSKNDVIARAADFLVDHGMKSNGEITAQLGYVPSSERSNVFVPSVIYTMNDGPTPVVFSVPVVSPSDRDDE